MTGWTVLLVRFPEEDRTTWIVADVVCGEFWGHGFGPTVEEAIARAVENGERNRQGRAA